jgi:ABC-2 type transport system ATP-binding protein
MKKSKSIKPIIEVKNVSKNFKLPHDRKNSLKQHFVGLFRSKSSYEKFEALKNISFNVEEGDFFGIVGRNGSGKSTLLKIISGIYQPNSGSVKINGTLTPFIELGIGFNPELTGRENVYLNGSILGLTKKEIDELYDEIVRFAELERFMDQKLKNYSSGMQVRLAFSIAIRAQNDILLLDEVLAVGDINFQKKCFNYFNKLKKEKKTVIFVSHDINTVEKYCNKGIYIKDSLVVKNGDINEITKLYKKDLLIDFENELENSETSNNIEKNKGNTADDDDNLKEVKAGKPISVESVNLNGAKNNKIKKQNELIKVDIIYKANKFVENPIFGILIFHESNPFMPAFGVNTCEPERLKDTVLRPNQKTKFSISLPNKFSEGSYNAKVAAADSSGVIVFDELTINDLFRSDATENNFSIFQSDYLINLEEIL